jgi:hypothetical protein
MTTYPTETERKRMSPEQIAARVGASVARRNIAGWSSAREALRAALGCKRLPPGLGEICDAAHQLALERRMSTARPVARPMSARLLDYVRDVARPIVSDCFRNASGAYAGGDTLVGVTRCWPPARPGFSAREPTATGAAARRWSVSGKWSGNDAEYDVRVSRHWLRDVYRRGLAAVDGVFTLDLGAASAARVADADVFAGVFARQGRGFALEVERGGLAVDHEGAITHLSIREMDALAAGGRKAAAVAKRVQAAREARAARAVRDERTDLVRFLDLHPEVDTSVEVTVRDSVTAGNCLVGTSGWVARHFPGRTRATLRELLEVAHATGDRVAYVERIALHVASRARSTAA